jgi:general secretion pathway protein H
VLVLGPEPLIGAQSVSLSSVAAPDREMRIATDGLRPFKVQPQQAAP